MLIAYIIPVLCCTSRVPADGKSSVCVICMNYRIIVLIIIVIRLGQIILSYMASTSLMHACTHAHSHTLACAHRPTHPPPSPSRLSLLHGRCAPKHDEHTPSFRLFRCQLVTGCTVSRYEQLERHLPRRSSKNCDLQFANTDRKTDRLKENYSIDYSSTHFISLFFLINSFCFRIIFTLDG